MAFISSIVLSPRGSALTASSTRGPAVTSRTAARNGVRMEMSPSVPFLEKPPRLSPDMPGYAGFDPLGFSNFFDVKFLQEAEIKHARICMLAVLGIIVNEFYTLPFYQGAPKLPTPVHDWGVAQGSLQQLLLWTSAWEIIVGVPAVVQMMSLGSPRRPGEFSFDPLGLAKTNEAFKKNGTAELVNGRLAMIAVGGLLHQQFLTQMTPVQQLMSGKILP